MWLSLPDPEAEAAADTPLVAKAAVKGAVRPRRFHTPSHIAGTIELHGNEHARERQVAVFFARGLGCELR